jgi:(p)ppGpp synthase/HD superfamily hydrolase
MKHPLIKAAAQFAAKAHKEAGQTRKYCGSPYIVHPAEVAKLVSMVTDDVATIAAAWLHDTIEDTDCTYLEIKNLFGDEIADIVMDLTDISQPQDGNRETRKEIDRYHTACGSQKAHTVKLADLISNTRSIVEHDPDFAVVYLKEKEKLLEVLQDGSAILYGIAADSLIQGKLALAERK